MDFPYLLAIGGLTCIGTGLLIYIVRDQKRARKERRALADEVSELRKQLAKRHGHERADELLAHAGIPQLQAQPVPSPKQPKTKKQRHLTAVPPLAIVGVATEWVRDHPLPATVGLLGLAATLALTASAPWGHAHHTAPPPAIALPAPPAPVAPAPQPPATTPPPVAITPVPPVPQQAAPAPAEPITEPITPAPRIPQRTAVPASTPRGTAAALAAPPSGQPPSSAPPPAAAAPACQGIDFNLRPLAGLCLLG